LSPLKRQYALYCRLAYAYRILTKQDLVYRVPHEAALPGEISRICKGFLALEQERIYASPNGLGQISKEITQAEIRLNLRHKRRNMSGYPDSESEFSDSCEY